MYSAFDCACYVIVDQFILCDVFLLYCRFHKCWVDVWNPNWKMCCEWLGVTAAEAVTSARTTGQPRSHHTDSPTFSVRSPQSPLVDRPEPFTCTHEPIW